jgi:hypothetical protein
MVKVYFDLIEKIRQSNGLIDGLINERKAVDIHGYGKIYGEVAAGDIPRV